MTESMIERVENAIRAELEKRGVILVNGDDSLAIAAVRALREPTAALREVGGRRKGCSNDGGSGPPCWHDLSSHDRRCSLRYGGKGMSATLKVLLDALRQVEAEMKVGLGSHYGETREQVRRAIRTGEAFLKEVAE